MVREDAREWTEDEWLREAELLFGGNVMFWRFQCPMCGHIQTPHDFLEAGASPHAAYVNCIGRYTGGGKFGSTKPCDYAGGGLFQSPWVVHGKDGKDARVLPFAPPILERTIGKRQWICRVHRVNEKKWMIRVLDADKKPLDYVRTGTEANSQRHWKSESACVAYLEACQPGYGVPRENDPWK